MKAQELMIGNYVHDHLGRVQRVAEIRGDAYICYLSNGTKLKYRLNTTEPIPLSEEWLFKFGFEKRDVEFPSYTKKGIQINYIDGKWVEYARRIEVKTVHQLQNLYYALTGNELELLK